MVGSDRDNIFVAKLMVAIPHPKVSLYLYPKPLQSHEQLFYCLGL